MPTDDKTRLLAELTETIRLEPHNAECLARRAKCFSDLGDDDRALADANEAITIDSRLDYAWAVRGYIHQHRQEYDAALDDYSEAIRLNPNNVNAWGGRGIIQVRHMNQYQAAELDLTRSIQLQPNRGHAYLHRARANWHLGRAEQALADYDRAISLLSQQHPPHSCTASVAFFERGDFYFQKNDLARAIEDFTEAIRLDPNYWEAYERRAKAFRALGDNLNAQQDEGKVKEGKRKGEKEKGT